MGRFFYMLAIACLFCAPAVAQDAKAAPSTGVTQPTPNLTLEARLIDDGDPIPAGLTWRIFDDSPNAEGTHPLVTNAVGGTAQFNLPSGPYLVHVAYGRAGATKRIIIGSEPVSETIALRAGGLRLAANTANGNVDPEKLRFSIYEIDQDENGDRNLIALNVPAGSIVRLNEGVYHVLSRYGGINATVRADLEVKAGKVTSAELEHRGAEITMRLVSRAGGDPIANTAWTVLTADGAKVFSSRSVSPGFVLSEGEYEVNVRNGEQVYRKSFTVKSGSNQRVEVRIDSDAG
ncbi:MAG: hypothetical protein AAFO70_06970 [Pseudomonadota bacterium]